jgi:hypothetical protein
MCVNAYQAAANLYQMPVIAYHARLVPRLSLALCNSTCVHAYVCHSALNDMCVCVCVCVHVCVCVCVTWHGRMQNYFTELADVITLLLLQRLICLITVIVVVDAVDV